MPRILLTLFSVSFLFSCAKHSADLKKGLEQQDLITGTWELRQLSGTDMSPDIQGDYPEGNGQILVITDSTMARYKFDSLIYSEPFSLVSGDTCWDHAGGPAELPRLAARAVFFDLDGDHLTVYSGHLASGGAIEKFARLK